jgi:hypothetical protein
VKYRDRGVVEAEHLVVAERAVVWEAGRGMREHRRARRGGKRSGSRRVIRMSVRDQDRGVRRALALRGRYEGIALAVVERAGIDCD